MIAKNEIKLNFEDALKELEEISVKLSEGNIPLDESIKLFEKGMELKKFCAGRLKSAKQKIKILIDEEEKDYSDE